MCSDGKYYEKDAILEYMKKSDISPLTRQPFSIEYVQNDMTSKINQFLNENEELKEEQYYKELQQTELQYIFQNTEDHYFTFKEWLDNNDTKQKKSFIRNLTNKQEKIDIANEPYFNNLRTHLTIGDFLLLFEEFELFSYWNDLNDNDDNDDNDNDNDNDYQYDYQKYCV